MRVPAEEIGHGDRAVPGLLAAAAPLLPALPPLPIPVYDVEVGDFVCYDPELAAGAWPAYFWHLLGPPLPGM